MAAMNSKMFLCYLQHKNNAAFSDNGALKALAFKARSRCCMETVQSKARSKRHFVGKSPHRKSRSAKLVTQKHGSHKASCVTVTQSQQNF